MNTVSRKENSLRNFIFSIIYYAINVVLAFITRTIFLHYLSVEYLGLNSLFTNILSVLSLAELGFGTAIIFSMYKPFAKNDEEKIRQLIFLYKKFYFIIGLIVLVLGLILLPFIKGIVGDVPSLDVNLYIVYFIFLFNNVMTYFLSYRRSLLLVSQRNDIESKVNIAKVIFVFVLQVIVLLFTQNYYGYIIISTIASILENLTIYFVTNKKYPQFVQKPKEKLNAKEIKVINKNVYSLIYHKLGGVAIFGIDSILISMILSIAILGVYSNYLLLTTYIATLIVLLPNAMKGSIGNYISTKNSLETESLLKDLSFIWFWILGFCSISLMNLFQPFISLWLGGDFLLSNEVVIIIALGFYINNSRVMMNTVKDCAGLFYEDRFKPLLEVALKLGLSIFLGLKIGLLGILLGTLLSNILAPLWIEPFVVYKYLFKKRVTNYYLSYLRFFLTNIFIAAITYFSCWIIPDGTILLFIAKIFVCLIVPNFLFFILHFKTAEFKNSINMIKSMLADFNHKRKKSGNLSSHQK